MTALREHQLRLLELLKDFDSICSKCGITWWIDSGTLLGAARHGGFIPWDDDVDVCILAKDLPKIKRLLSANCPYPLAFDSDHNGKTRLSPRFIDKSQFITRIDPQSGLPKKENLWIDTFVLRPVNLIVKKIIDPVYGRCIRRIYGGIQDGKWKKALAYMVYPLAWVATKAASALGRAFHAHNLLHDFGVPFYSVRRSEDIFPLGRIEFEGQFFPAPARTDKYLRRIYGDYMKLPDKKVSHDIQF